MGGAGSPHEPPTSRRCARHDSNVRPLPPQSGLACHLLDSSNIGRRCAVGASFALLFPGTRGRTGVGRRRFLRVVGWRGSAREVSAGTEPRGSARASRWGRIGGRRLGNHDLALRAADAGRLFVDSVLRAFGGVSASRGYRDCGNPDKAVVSVLPRVTMGVGSASPLSMTERLSRARVHRRVRRRDPRKRFLSASKHSVDPPLAGPDTGRRTVRGGHS